MCGKINTKKQLNSSVAQYKIHMFAARILFYYYCCCFMLNIQIRFRLHSSAECEYSRMYLQIWSKNRKKNVTDNKKWIHSTFVFIIINPIYSRHTVIFLCSICTVRAPARITAPPPKLMNKIIWFVGVCRNMHKTHKYKRDSFIEFMTFFCLLSEFIPYVVNICVVWRSFFYFPHRLLMFAL